MSSAPNDANVKDDISNEFRPLIKMKEKSSLERKKKLNNVCQWWIWLIQNVCSVWYPILKKMAHFNMLTCALHWQSSGASKHSSFVIKRIPTNAAHQMWRWNQCATFSKAIYRSRLMIESPKNAMNEKWFEWKKIGRRQCDRRSKCRKLPWFSQPGY